MGPIAIRPASVQQLEQVLGWAREEGWGPGLEDAPAFHAADPEGFLIGWLGTLPIGSISLVRYGEDQAFLGLFIVRPAFRGRGFGKALWQAAMDRAGSRTIGLDAVPAQIGRYAAAGFAPAYRTTRWSGHLRGLVATRSMVRPLRPEDADAVADYDARAFGAPRPAFLASWLGPTATRQSEAYVEDGVLRGYGTVRRTVVGWKIGPLFADSAAIAEALLATLVTPAGTDELAIDIPAPNLAGTALAERLGFKPGFETTRMYRGPAPRQPMDRIFGVTTLELG
jgi:GNAT superfamily N-acetyltransferase